MKKYKYKVESCKSMPREEVDLLNKMGKDGWELVCKTDTIRNHSFFYFKKEVK